MQRAEIIKRVEQTVHNLNDKGLEIVSGVFVELEKAEEYSIHTTKERLKQIKTEEEQKAAEEKARKEQEQLNKPNPYGANETMKMLGKHCHLEVIRD